MELLNFENLSADTKRDVAFQLVVAIRDTISIATKKQQPPTYENSLRLLHDFSPELYETVTKILTNKNINDTAKYYKERAEIETLKAGHEVTPIQLLQKDIKEHRELLETPDIDKEQTKFINLRLLQLETAIQNLKPRRLTEHRILQRDFTRVDRNDLGATIIEQNDFFVDYNLTNQSYLRIRLLHPDQFEYVTGADLIYEQHDEDSNKIRIMVLQYKTWEDGVLYFSQHRNLEEQLLKLKTNFCDAGFCGKPDHLEGELDYRFPYCCAFLRPTDKLQHDNSKMVSSGIHIPVCSALQLKQELNGIISQREIRHQKLTHKIFENLFNNNFIGSKWLNAHEVENFYRQKKILDATDTVKIYAREIHFKEESPF